VVLLEHGYDCFVIDNFDNSSLESIRRVREITGCSSDSLTTEECDLVDLEKTKAVVAANGPFIGCIHFAGFKAVGESVQLPLHYYYNNVVGSLNLFAAMEANNIKVLVFSSSCTVYGDSQNVPFKETEPITTANCPYGQTKIQIEQIIRDLVPATKMSAVLLRYFNPVGAHPSGRIGEDPKGVPTNLLPYVAQVAVGMRDKISVFGNDYPTPDGTGVRDYIHVMDLAEAHLLAIEKACKHKEAGCLAYNIGTGKGSSVVDVIKAFEKASGKVIPYVFAPRRAGDVASAYCDPTLAKEELGFVAKRTLYDACVDSWKWQSENPSGYGNAASIARKAKVFEMFSVTKQGL
jgi:UDP-glucose 4-epimerase